MNSEIKVSVIIGTYNRENLVSRTIDSVLSQTYKNIELIIVDDFSNDNTLEVLEKYRRKYPDQIKLLKNESNRGISYNCNKAYKVSDGEYVALLGDDDYWTESGKIEKQLTKIQSDPEMGIIGTWWKEESESNVLYKKPLEPKNWPERMLSRGGVICGSTSLIRRTAWDKVGGFDENQKKGTDSDLFRRIVLSGFKAQILYEVTTSVDVNIDRRRMTVANSESGYQVGIEAMEYNLEKLALYYSQYPEAKLVYYEKLAWLFFKKYLLSSNVHDLEKHNFYINELGFKKVFQLNAKKRLFKIGGWLNEKRITGEGL